MLLIRIISVINNSTVVIRIRKIRIRKVRIRKIRIRIRIRIVRGRLSRGDFRIRSIDRAPTDRS